VTPLTGRRRFLQLGAGVAAAVGFWRLLALARPAQIEGGLLRVFNELESARAVGYEYLKVAPQEASQKVLVRLLSKDMPGVWWFEGSHSLRDHLALQIIRDFERHRTVEVSGWILSLTEARLCALTTMS
jgi:hypothetical protein